MTYWDDVAVAQAQLDIVAVINPKNEPSETEQSNPDYQIGLQTLREAGVTVLGYVATCWANLASSAACYNQRSMDDIKYDIRS